MAKENPITLAKTALASAAADASSVIANATANATATLSTATQQATITLANAAEAAARVVANVAAETAKTTTIQNAGDHDMLIKLETKMDGLKEDIKGLKDGTKGQLDDHESRINKIEDGKTKQTVMLSIGIGLLSLISYLMIEHIIK
jgi:hypothetical protein